MTFALSVLCAYLIVGTSKIEGSEILTAPSYLANYASSYNSHVINHDIRYPVAPVVTPLAAPIAPLLTPLTAAPVVTSAVKAAPVLPLAPITQLSNFASLPISRFTSQPSITPFPQVFSQALSAYQAAPVSFPVFQYTPQIQPVATPQVELAARSSERNQLAPQVLANAPSDVSRSTQPGQPQANSEPVRLSSPNNGPVPSSVLASSQFLARQFSQQRPAAPLPQQGSPEPNQQIPSRHPDFRSSPEVPQQQANQVNAPLPQTLFRSEQGPKPRFLITGNAFPNNEKLNGEDSESVEVNSAESGEVPTSNRKELPPTARLEAPKTRILYSPVSVLRSPLPSNAYTQVITF